MESLYNASVAVVGEYTRSHDARTIDSKNAIKIIDDTLLRVDHRLVNHGQRVAYIMLKMLNEYAEYCERDKAEICILGIFHDIGAYKTEEIDKMVQFETDNILDHSIYGYLFLKYLSPLANRAEAVLYHHFTYEKLKSIDTNFKYEALLISLCDRIDILLQQDASLENISRASGSTFDPEQVELFWRCEKKYHIVENLKNGTYKKEINGFTESLIFTDREINEYLQMLAYSIDFRSVRTVTHTINTIGFSIEIALRLGCLGDTLHNIYYGALLHDIGKISTPLEILESSGKLSATDMEIMKKHVSTTEEILKGIVTDDICNIAVRHHEKIDGSGYPYGLTGDKLTHGERIVAVADIISALQGERSYKRSFPKKQILEIITNMRDAGKLCPKVCNLVLSCYGEIEINVERRNKQVIANYKKISDEFKVMHNKLVETCS